MDEGTHASAQQRSTCPPGTEAAPGGLVCTKKPSSTDTKIVGTIKDRDRDPVPGLLVRVRGAGSDRTDAKGYYEIDVSKAPGRHVVEPRSSAATFEPKISRVTVRRGETTGASFLMTPERQITGRVTLDCKGVTSCRIMPVSGVRIRASGARSYTATTDDEGRYKLAVGKGRYAVRASAGLLRITTGPERVDVRTRRRGSASFGACGIRMGTGASAAAVTGGRWFGKSDEDCTSGFDILWRPAAGALTVTWAAARVCPGQPRPVVRYVQGTLNADGTGQAQGRLHDGGCVWGGDMKVPIRRR